MTEIALKFSQTGAPVLNVDDAGGKGLPVIFQHGLCGDARQTIEAFPQDPRFRRITIEARGHVDLKPAIPRCSQFARLPLMLPPSSMPIGSRLSLSAAFRWGRRSRCILQCTGPESCEA
jgi:hypothetical protein